MITNTETFSVLDIKNKRKKGWALQKIANYYGVNYSTIWKRLNPERFKEMQDKYSHTDKRKIVAKRYSTSPKGREKLAKRRKPDEGREGRRREKQTKKGRERIKRHQRTDKRKEVVKRNSAKRRELGFEPLNNHFERSAGHHIDKEQVIYIPQELHRSIHHDIWTGQGIERINKEAFEFLERQLIQKQWDVITNG